MSKIKTIKFPKEVKFEQGVSSCALYAKGLSDSQLEKLSEVITKTDSKFIETILSTDEKLIDEWDFKNCGSADFAIINFGKNLDISNLLLLATKYYTRFSPIIYIMLDENHKQFSMIRDYAAWSHVEIKTFPEILKLLKIAIEDT